MPHDYRLKGIQHYYYPSISVIGYYALVLSSLTGLSTLLNWTSFSHAEENMDGVRECDDITDDIKIFINKQDPASCITIRKFEYNFFLPGIQVKMFHVLENNRLHLVEIYHQNKLRMVQLSALGGVLLYSFVRYIRTKYK